MSEADVRSPPSRGRSSARGGRGGFGRGGPRGGRNQANGTANDNATLEEESLEEQGALGEMKKKYFVELGMLKDMFPTWTDTDLVFALEEADGDLPSCVDKITQGQVSQFAEVKKSKDRARSKAKEDSTIAGATDKPGFAPRGRGGRGGLDGTRGGRGRGVERGRGGQRGGRGGHATTNGTEAPGATSIPTTESSAWDTPAATTEVTNNSWDDSNADVSKDAADPNQSGWGNVGTADTTPAAVEEEKKSSLIPEGVKKSWASMFAKPKTAPAPAVPKQVSTKQPEPAPAPLPAAPVEEPKEEPAPVPSVEEPQDVPVSETPADRPATAETDMLTPSQDPLTEANVEHLPDESNPPATQTVASTAGSIDPRNLTPLPQQAPIGRPPLGGFATSANNRLAGAGGARSASFQRRVLEQQEAVVMPGHNAVDRAAVQFGSMGLNGEPGLDVDEEREEPETRHAPQHSPPSQPRTSLPPVPRQASGAQDLPEAVPTPKQAPGLPPASAQNQQQIQDPSLAQNIPQDQQMNQAYNQYGRYGQQGMQQEAQQQKQYDPFGHQAQHSFDQYAGHQQQQQSQSQFGGLSSAPSDYSQYYTADPQQSRNAYNQYYGSSYGQQQQQHDLRSQQQGQQDPTIGQQRSTSGFGAGQNDSTLAAQSQQQVSISHYNDLTKLYDSAENEVDRDGILQAMHAAQKQMQSRASSIHDAYQSEGHHRQPSSSEQQNMRFISSNTSDTQQASRFNEAPSSGHNTPNPTMANPQQQHSMHQAQSHQQQPQGAYPPGASAAFPYGHPYYNSPYQQAYANQFGGYSHAGYGGASGYPTQQQQKQQGAVGAGAMYGAPQGYGQQQSSYGQQQSAYAQQQSSYDPQHSASPANTHAFAQNQQASMRSASGMGGSGLGGLDDYGRQSAQPSSHQQSHFGGMNDPFARTSSGFGTQGAYGQQQQGGDDSLKAFVDPSTAAKSGPSPQPGRPGSAANSAAGNVQAGSGLPPPQSQHSAFGGGYPGFPGQSQYGGLGGLGSHGQQQGQQGQQAQQSAYGSYGAGGFSQAYGGYGGSRGGWGQQYGGH
ncbi:uncharacterized protein MYCGRDRAFT_107910 [Zymoseptoria tritici IPO323]|uniref:RNA polymerase II degradation factor 1 n=1 Tax=Zymoseptoria tritici (strain CBS 115943 / IPO323) TaxID=336722 RepID=F9X236_ZYMTI|nr:uncharacterized protein MYCGRDRAFT_107910 [Zymoseptoria tritici IPO323]EGP89787.1 hypothetical protein MYCGRDRAFT_107910 [Zymoseptoria tritici IPO323]